LQYVQRFPRLADLAGTRLTEATANLVTTGWSPVQAARSGHWQSLLTAARLCDDRHLADALVHAAVFDRPAAITDRPSAATRWQDPRRYELVDLLLSKTTLGDDQIRYLLDRLSTDHIEELQQSARKRSRLHRLCTEAIQTRKPPQPPRPQRAETQPQLELHTDDELSEMADPHAVLSKWIRDRSNNRQQVLAHALSSKYMKDDLAWRLPVQDLERHPTYGPKLAAKIAEICGNSTKRWQAFAQSWTQPTQLVATTLFQRLEAADPHE
jgi:hypothetical protein